LLWRIPTFKSLLCWLTFCHCFLFFITIIIIIIMDSCTLHLTNSTYLQPPTLSLSLSLYNEFFICIFWLPYKKYKMIIFPWESFWPHFCSDLLDNPKLQVHTIEITYNSLY
jgi:hypothetical protein